MTEEERPSGHYWVMQPDMQWTIAYHCGLGMWRIIGNDGYKKEDFFHIIGNPIRREDQSATGWETADEIREAAPEYGVSQWLPRSQFAEFLAAKLDMHYNMGQVYERALVVLDRRGGRLMRREALKRVQMLMDAERGTIEGEELDCLARLVEFYERCYMPAPEGNANACVSGDLSPVALLGARLVNNSDRNSN